MPIGIEDPGGLVEDDRLRDPGGRRVLGLVHGAVDQRALQLQVDFGGATFGPADLGQDADLVCFLRGLGVLDVEGLKEFLERVSLNVRHQHQQAGGALV